MKNIYKLIIFISFFILGCTPNVLKEKKTTLKIDSLNLNIFSNSGDKKYSIASPYTSFDNSQQKFKLKKTTINIFDGEETKYIINSDESTLSDNNKILEMNGNVQLKTTKKEEDTLFADNFIWNIDETNYLLTGNIRFENKNIILKSGKAKLGTDNIIEFFKPVKYIIKKDNNDGKYEINSENAYYNLNTKTVNFNSNEERVRSTIYF